MAEPLTLLLAIVLANNLVLAHLVGVESVVASDRLGFDRLLALGVFTTLATGLAAALCWPLDHFFLQPLAWGFLRTPSVILIVAAMPWLMGLSIARWVPGVRETWQELRWLVLTNSAVLGGVLVALQQAGSFAAAVLLGLGGGLAYTGVLLLFAGLRSRLAQAEVPAPLRGAPIELLTAALMALAFLGLSGLERHV
jgi:electron transport complex protein RnfA